MQVIPIYEKRRSPLAVSGWVESQWGIGLYNGDSEDGFPARRLS